MDSEELFPPREGGAVHAHRERMAQSGSVALAEVEQVPHSGYPVVRVATAGAEVGTSRTIVVGTSAPPSGLVPVLGRSARRHRAVLTALDVPVLVATSRQAIDAGVGAATGTPLTGIVIPPGQSLTVEDQAEWYAILAPVPAPVTAPVTVSASASNYGTVTSPGAAANIVQVSGLTPGAVYQVAWAVELSGTLAAADQDNFRLIGTGGARSVNPAAAGVYQQQGMYVTPAGATITVQAQAAATVGAVYAAQLVATLVAVAPAAVTTGRLSVLAEMRAE